MFIVIIVVVKPAASGARRVLPAEMILQADL
jgi:hypothetical protein